MSEKYCVSPYASILEAMKKIDSSGIATVVVCEDGKAKGVLTDGDIRRALIKGAELTSPIEPFFTRNFIFVGPSVLRADVLDVMQAQLIEQVPIIDSEGTLKGIHTLHSILGHSLKQNWAVIMAGGKGTRLGKVTADIPKPMLKVAGKPILERLVLHLVSYGIRKIFISVNHLSHVIENYFKDGSEWGCSIEYLREDEPLGTGGALSMLPTHPKYPLILINGDLLMEIDFSKLLKFHEVHNFYATMGVNFYSHEVPFGCVETEQHQILRLEEKPLLSKFINAGIYVLSPAAVQSVPKGVLFPITRLFDEALSTNKPCGAYPLDGDWIDIGSPEGLKEARGEM
jgi:dTDP-glucose pyrophosphorylase